MNKFNYVTENEFPFHSVQDWEMEVRRNLKLEADKDLYSVLAKHNSLGIKSKGFYTALDIQNISPIGEEIFHSVGLNYVFDNDIDIENIDNTLSISADFMSIEMRQYSKNEGNEYPNSYIIDAKITKELTNNSITENATILTLYNHLLTEKLVNAKDRIELVVIDKYINSDFLSEIATLRSLRLLLDYTFDEFNSKNDNKFAKPNIIIKTKSCINNKSSLDLYSNIIRLTLETLSSFIGNSDLIESFEYDFGLGGNIDSQLMFDNIMRILIEESNVDRFIDVLSGSYYIESLTDESNKATINLFNEMNSEQTENFDEFVLEGHFNELVQKLYQQVKSNIETARTPFIGVNKIYNSLGDDYRIIEELLENEKNGLILNISQRFAEEFETIKLQAHKRHLVNSSNELFEEVYLVNIGSKLDYLPRLDYAKDILGLLSLNYTESIEFELIEDIIDTCNVKNPPIIAVCSTNKIYSEILRELTLSIKKSLPNSKLIVFGNPKDFEIDTNSIENNDHLLFIFKGSNLVEIGNKLNSHLAELATQ